MSGAGSFVAVAVGMTPGVYTTAEDAKAAVGDHPLPLAVPCKSASAAHEFVNKFTDACAVVYTDGACKANGKPGAVAGVGVYWGPDDPRNVSRRVRGSPSTNNVAELEGIEDAIDAIVADAALTCRRVVIVSDSKYSIDCLTTWYDGYCRRGWVTTKGDPVMNQEMIRRIHAKLTPNIVFAHIRGHMDHIGNIMADKLATSACV